MDVDQGGTNLQLQVHLSVFCRKNIHVNSESLVFILNNNYNEMNRIKNEGEYLANSLF